jgi:hypothetical protein
MKIFKLYFEKEFNKGTIKTKEICGQLAVIIIENNCISIEFDKEIEIKNKYIDQMAAFLRNYSILTGQVHKLVDIDFDKKYFLPLQYQSLLFSSSNENLIKCNVDLNGFFGKYKSSSPAYKYINNSIPWLIILSETTIFVEKIRILFTLLEMYISKYLTEKENIHDRYIKFYDNITIDGASLKNIVKEMLNIWNNISIKNKKNEFTGIARLVNGVMNTHKDKDNDKMLMGEFAYNLRNKNFHGNMSPVISIASEENIILQIFYDITIKGIYEYLIKIINEL